MTPRAAIADGFRSFRPYLLVGSVAALLFFFALGSCRTLTNHEVLLAGSAKQMVAERSWLVPYIGDMPRLEKPPLPQWIVGVWAMIVGDFNELVVRMPFAAFGVIVILLETALMTRLFDVRTGVWCGLIQASCVYQVAHARLAESDIILQALVLGAITLLVCREWGATVWTARQHRAAQLGFWVLIGLMNLLKGVGFGAILTVLTCAGWMILRGNAHGLRKWWSWPGVVLAALIGLAWPVAVAVYEPEGVGIWKEQILGRATGSLGHHQPVWYYLLHWPVQLLPWTPFLFIGAAASWKRARTEPASADRLLWWWALSHPALLTLSSGKHHHYLIYALPALTPIIVQGLFRTGEDLARRWNVTRTSPTWRYAGPGFLSVVILGHLFVQSVILPRRDPSAADTQFLAEVENTVPKDSTLMAFGGQEVARHVFYVHRPLAGVSHVDRLVALAHNSREMFVIARGHAVEELQQAGTVTEVLQSRATRREKSLLDRYTLFRLTRRDALAAESSERRKH